METGELVEKALDKARDDSMTNAEFVDESWLARQADALVAMLSSYLSGDLSVLLNNSPAGGMADRYESFRLGAATARLLALARVR